MIINSRIVGMRRTGELRMKEYEVMKEIINSFRKFSQFLSFHII